MWVYHAEMDEGLLSFQDVITNQVATQSKLIKFCCIDGTWVVVCHKSKNISCGRGGGGDGVSCIVINLGFNK